MVENGGEDEAVWTASGVPTERYNTMQWEDYTSLYHHEYDYEDRTHYQHWMATHRYGKVAGFGYTFSIEVYVAFPLCKA
jgi:hypothetical protein